MNVRIKLEPKKSSGDGRYAYASDEHPGATRGLPEILLNGEVYPPHVLEFTIVTSGKLIAEHLRKSGYDVRIVGPRAAYM